VFTHFFNVRQENLAMEAGELLSAEGRLIEELKRDAEQRLRAKDAEISQVQDRLTALDAERQSLQDTLEERVGQREAELRRDLEAELAAERERLRELGTSEADIEQKLRALEESKTREYEQALTAYRQESEAELKAKEEELAAATLQLEQTLEQSSREKDEISRQAEAREEELRRRYEQEAAALKAESSQAEKQLAELAELRRREELFTDQIMAAYTDVLTDLEAGKEAAARRELSGLAALLADAATEDLPAVARRKRVDQGIVASLGELLDLRAAARPPAAAAGAGAGAAEAGALREELERLVEEAGAAARAGELEKAAAVYNRALTAVPPLDEAHRELSALEGRSREEAMSRSATEAESLQRALASRRREIAALQAQVSERDEQIAALQKRLAAAQSAASAATAGQEIAPDEAQITSRARAAAFRDLQTYLRAQADLSAYPEVQNALDREPQFRRVVADIEALLARGGEEEAMTAAIVRLLGTVSRVLPDQVVIEPLVKVRAEAGTAILIRRNVLGREVSIARGTIDSVLSDRIIARITQIFQAGQLPAEQDTVYLTR
jgi:chromosome segregation ATPase